MQSQVEQGKGTTDNLMLLGGWFLFLFSSSSSSPSFASYSNTSLRLEIRASRINAKSEHKLAWNQTVISWHFKKPGIFHERAIISARPRFWLVLCSI